MGAHLQKLVLDVLHRAQSSAKGRKQGMMECNCILCKSHGALLLHSRHSFAHTCLHRPDQESHGTGTKGCSKLVRESECAESTRILLFDLLQGGCGISFVDVLWT